MAGRFARGFQDCWHHPTGGVVHSEGPTVVESCCLSAAGVRRSVCCAVVADALSQVKSSKLRGTAHAHQQNANRRLEA